MEKIIENNVVDMNIVSDVMSILTEPLEAYEFIIKIREKILSMNLTPQEKIIHAFHFINMDAEKPKYVGLDLMQNYLINRIMSGKKFDIYQIYRIDFIEHIAKVFVNDSDEIINRLINIRDEFKSERITENQRMPTLSSDAEQMPTLSSDAEQMPTLSSDFMLPTLSSDAEQENKCVAESDDEIDDELMKLLNETHEIEKNINVNNNEEIIHEKVEAEETEEEDCEDEYEELESNPVEIELNPAAVFKSELDIFCVDVRD